MRDAFVMLPGENGTWQPCPELLTPKEAISYLRLDVMGAENPERTLKYYRDKGLLKGTMVGKRILYRRIELERFLERLTERNPK